MPRLASVAVPIVGDVLEALDVARLRQHCHSTEYLEEAWSWHGELGATAIRSAAFAKCMSSVTTKPRSE